MRVAFPIIFISYFYNHSLYCRFSKSYFPPSMYPIAKNSYGLPATYQYAILSKNITFLLTYYDYNLSHAKLHIQTPQSHDGTILSPYILSIKLISYYWSLSLQPVTIFMPGLGLQYILFALEPNLAGCHSGNAFGVPHTLHILTLHYKPL